VFSNQALIAPYQDGTSLQFRLSNARSNVLLDVEARVLLMTVETVEGELKRNFFDLPLERTKVYFFPLTWTVVHPIDAASPLFGKTAQDLAAVKAELLILIQAFDDTFSQLVHSRYSYRHDELVWNARYQPAFTVGKEGELILDLEKVSDQRILP